MKYILILAALFSFCDAPAPGSNLTVSPAPTIAPIKPQQLYPGARIRIAPTQAELGTIEPGSIESGVNNQPSYEVLHNNQAPGPDGQPNRFFLTEEQARRLGRKKYTSGPCRNYHEGEEWWCR